MGILVGSALLVAAAGWWSGRDGARDAHGNSVEGSAKVAAVSSPLPAMRPLSVVDTGSEQSDQSKNADVRSQFRASNDYWEFAERVHEAAKQGDGAAQYYLGVVLESCQLEYGYFFFEGGFGPNPRIRTLEEAQQLTATERGSGYTPDEVRRIQSRCQRIMNEKPRPFGSANDWLIAAMKSGYPMAQVRAATMTAVNSRDLKNSEARRAAQEEARAYALDALRTKDPEVIWELSSTAAFLTEGGWSDVHTRQWTWRMAACLREPNCNSMSEWKHLLCEVDSQCHRDDTVMDVIRRGIGNEFGDIERRARELNEKIDTGKVDTSDL